MIVTFLTDFGLVDDFVGTCKGVIKQIAPAAEIVDITHGIRPQQVLEGALVLARTVPYMPEGVHLAVVDPGVGTERKALCIRDRDGRLFVGPDNGLLVPAADRAGIDGVWQLAEPAFRLPRVSKTFHGRDVFAPAAAHLTLGVDPAALGPPVEPYELVRLDIPEAEVGERRIRATVLRVDTYGNVELNVNRDALEAVGIETASRVEIDVGLGRYYATVAETFADCRAGDVVLLEDSYGGISVAITSGDAARLLGLRAGSELRLSAAS